MRLDIYTSGGRSTSFELGQLPLYFVTGYEFKYALEKRLNGQREIFYFTANENSEIIANCTDRGGEYTEK